MILSFLLGCDPTIDQVVLSGVVQDAPGGAGNNVAGSALVSRDRDGATVGEAESAADGSFAIDVPAGASFYLELSADGYVPTGFSSFAGTEDFQASTGYPWIATTVWLDNLRSTYETCESVGATGGVFAGQVLAAIEGIGDPGSWPAVSGAVVAVIGNDVVELPTCYLDDEGLSVAGLGTTGTTGEYAVFGVPPGGAVMQVDAERTGGEVGTDVFDFIMPEAGLVPVYPTPVEL